MENSFCFQENNPGIKSDFNPQTGKSNKELMPDTDFAGITDFKKSNLKPNILHPG